MVWVVTGNINSSPQDEPETIPEPSSHYLRPSRTYRIGRSGGLLATKKPGTDKEPPKTKDRLNDWNIKSLTVPKDGVCDLQLGDWDSLDNPDSPTNDLPYSLTIKIGKPTPIAREGGTETAPKGSVWHARSGDVLTIMQKNNKEAKIKLEWIPFNLTWPNMPAKDVARNKEQATSIGVKIISSKTVTPSHTTHVVARKAKPNAALCQAALLGLPIVSSAFFDQFALDAKAPLRPEGLVAPEHPQFDPAPADETEEEAKARVAKQDKELAQWEKKMIALDRNIGFDWSRWWGHSELEKNWNARAAETHFPMAISHEFPQYTPEGWATNEQRRSTFQGIVAVSYCTPSELTAYDRSYFELGGGHYLASGPLKPEVTLPTLMGEIEDFKKSKHITNFPGGLKFVLFADSEYSLVPTDGEPADSELLREVAQRLRVGKLGDTPALLQAIYEADSSSLMAPPLAPLINVPPTAATTQGSTSARGATTQNSLPFPSGGVAGTHPDSMATGSKRRASNEGGAEAGPSGLKRKDAGGEEEQPAPVKLVRRAKSRAPTRRLFDDDDDDDDQSAPAESTSRRLRTQETFAPSLNSSAPSAMEIDDAPTPAQPASTTGALKRRARSQRAATSLFDSDSESDLSQAVGASSSTYARSTKKTKEERMKEMEEEDDRAAAQLMKEKKEGKKLAPVAEEDDGKSSKTRRGKRDASVLDDDDDAMEAVSVKTTRKTRGTTPVVVVPTTTTARKRQKSVQPVEEEEEDPDPTPPLVKKGGKQPAASTIKGKAAMKKAEKEAKAKEEAHLLRMKTIKSKTKNAAVDAGFNEDFNALKIVKPVLKPMVVPQKHRMRWEEVDDEEEQMRLIREDQEAQDHPDQWAGKATQMFVVHELPLLRKERRLPRDDLPALAEKWAGVPNFKRFKPKGSNGIGGLLVSKKREETQLVLPKLSDFGLGDSYKSKAATRGGKEKIKIGRETSDSDDEMRDEQPLLNFKPKRKPATKGNAKKVVEDSDDDDDPAPSSRTLRAETNDSDDLEFMSVDSEGTTNGKKASKGKASTATKPVAAKKTPAARKPAARKAAPVTILIDDSDDSDDGKTFKGFVKGGVKRKR